MTIDTVERMDEMRKEYALSQKISGQHAYELLSNHGISDDVVIAMSALFRQADERAGLVTVPVEPTEGMIDAWHYAVKDWIIEVGEDADPFKAMLAASPFAPKVTK